MQVANDGIASLGHDVGFLVGVDGKDVLRRHRANPVLNCPRNTAGNIDVWSNAGTRLTNLVGVIAPTVVGNRARAADDSAK